MAKKFLVVGIIVMLITMGLSGCTDVQNEALRDLEYINNEHGFGLNPPENWDIKEPFSTSIVSFRGPTEGDYTTNICIYVCSAETGETLNSTMQGIVEQVEDTSALILVSYELRDVNGIDGCEVVYILSNVSMDEKIISIKEKIVCVMKNGQLFSIKYDASVNSYDTYLSVVEESISSFTIV